MRNKLICINHWKHCLLVINISFYHFYQVFLRKFVLDHQNNCLSTFQSYEMVNSMAHKY